MDRFLRVSALGLHKGVRRGSRQHYGLVSVRFAEALSSMHRSDENAYGKATCPIVCAAINGIS